MDLIPDALRTEVPVLWDGLGALVFGRLVSTGIQGLVSHKLRVRTPGERGAKARSWQ